LDQGVGSEAGKDRRNHGRERPGGNDLPALFIVGHCMPGRRGEKSKTGRGSGINNVPVFIIHFF
jgi:hypothetical protein